jgi:glyoxylase-like metal-dependent hydrolase (beta-lactamase superfamily II)
VVVVAGDVFWWADREEQKTDRESLLFHKDPFAKDEKALLASRRKILELADWIIPGHGKMFKNSRKFIG